MVLWFYHHKFLRIYIGVDRKEKKFMFIKKIPVDLNQMGFW
jgi:hypothetical protein